MSDKTISVTGRRDVPGSAPTLADRGEPELWAYLPSVGEASCDVAPAELVGATILFVGSPPCRRDDYGDTYPTLVVDYRRADGVERRASMAFTDLGMWVEKIEDRPSPNPGASKE